MTAATETLDTDELVLEVSLAQLPTPAVPRAPRAKSHPTTPRKLVEEQWSSTLGARDLRCLLSVIEEQLLPQMLRDYSPARCRSDRLPGASSDPLA